MFTFPCFFFELKLLKKSRKQAKLCLTTRLEKRRNLEAVTQQLTRNCAQARSRYQKKFSHWKLSPSNDSATQLDRVKKNLDEVIRDGKSKAWKEYASTLDPRVPSTKVCATLKGFDGRKRQPLPESAISEGSKVANTLKQKAEPAGTTYAEVSRVPVQRQSRKRLTLKYGGDCRKI